VDFFPNVRRSYLVNEIYAIDPESPKTIDQLALMALMFGFTEGRFIADFPDGWETKLISHFEKNNSIFSNGPQRLKLINFLEKFKEATIQPRKINYRLTKGWLENALDNINYHQFQAIICDNKETSSKCISIEDALYYEKLIDSRSCVVESNQQRYLDLLYPLLIKSTELYFQDVNLKLFYGVDTKYSAKKFIELLFYKIKETKRCNKITFILGEENYPDLKTRKKLEEEIKNMMIDHGPSYLSIHIKYSNKKESHERYAFSIRGGIRFGYGFDTPSRAKNTLSWMSKSELTNLLKQHNI
jgi:hypothetical protein